MTKYLSFDIEIATEPGMTRDWSEQHPFGITCAATWASGEDKPRVWCGRDYWRSISSVMIVSELSDIIDYLVDMRNKGYQVVTVNGAGFDFLEMYDNLEDPFIRDIALSHVDCFFDVFCRLGYAPGLDAMSKGMGLSGKMQGVDGASAPVLWANGEYGRVLSYVAQDAKQTLDLAEAVEAAGQLEWIARSGKRNAIKIDKWLTVAEAMRLAEPDVSWMAIPWKRDKFVGWLSNPPH